ncbi:MAG: DUF3365 domain-containing protein [Sphingobium sp.]
MRSFPFFVLLMPGLLCACASDMRVHGNPEIGADAEARSRDLADRFQKQLFAALTAALEQEGPAGAVGVCAEMAPAIAAQLSEESGAVVRRTALKPRNPSAAPDYREQQVMEGWASSSPMGADGKPVSWTGWSDDGSFRYMRAIPTMPMCLVCHGEAVAPDVAAAIHAHYPGDRATGFRAGEMRGAFSIRWDKVALRRIAFRKRIPAL